jgi:hypothetical protein
MCLGPLWGHDCGANSRAVLWVFLCGGSACRADVLPWQARNVKKQQGF